MSLPKEPRQKMINMMYLVLTALLALNVSVEVLNAFKTVNHSIERSNNVISEKNDMTYRSFQAKLSDPQTANLAKIWAPPALKVQGLSADLTKYIEDLKENLISKSNPQMKDGKREFTDGNLDAATRLFDTEKAGGVLYERLKKYRLDLLGLMDPSNFPDVSDAIKADLKA
ncbi:MAG TPA: gliding motility protein GldM, partial [Puia sp.]